MEASRLAQGQSLATAGRSAGCRRRGHLLTLIAHGWGQDNPAFRQVFAARLWPETTAEQSRSFDELQRLSASPQNAECIQRVVGDIDVTSLMSLVRAPTLVLHSRGDATVPRALGLMLAQGISGARFVELDSRNHFPLSHEAAWKTYIDEIIGFVENQGDRTLVASVRGDAGQQNP